MTDVVTPPDVTEWWDVADIAAAVRDILRLTDSDVDAARIAELVPAAGRRLNTFWDRTTPVDPADPMARRDLIDLTVAYYRDKDTPPTSPDLAFGVGYRPTDPLSQIRASALANKRRWGVG